MQKRLCRTFGIWKRKVSWLSSSGEEIAARRKSQRLSRHQCLGKKNYKQVDLCNIVKSGEARVYKLATGYTIGKSNRYRRYVNQKYRYRYRLRFRKLIASLTSLNLSPLLLLMLRSRKDEKTKMCRLEVRRVMLDYRCGIVLSRSLRWVSRPPAHACLYYRCFA